MKLDWLKRFLSWCFTKTVWHKIVWLIILLTLCAVAIFKDWDIKTRHGGCKTDTKIDKSKLDAEGTVEKINKQRTDSWPKDIPPHR